MSSSQPSTPVRSHPTLEQLESLPVIICSNGIGGSGEGNVDLKGFQFLIVILNILHFKNLRTITTIYGLFL